MGKPPIIVGLVVMKQERNLKISVHSFEKLHHAYIGKEEITPSPLRKGFRTINGKSIIHLATSIWSMVLMDCWLFEKLKKQKIAQLLSLYFVMKKVNFILAEQICNMHILIWFNLVITGSGCFTQPCFKSNPHFAARCIVTLFKVSVIST